VNGANIGPVIVENSKRGKRERNIREKEFLV
jgi:hypothetical protein